MLQQVNLYEPILSEEQKPFSAKAICVGLGVVAAGLMIITLFCWWRAALLDRQLRAIQLQEAAQKKFAERANAVVNLGENPQVIENRLKSLAIELERRQQVLRYLRGGDIGSAAGLQSGLNAAGGAARGFSDRMAALARQQLDGLWVTHATFTSDSAVFELAGSALSADLVPIYLGRLNSEQALAGIQLRSIEIRQPTNPARGDIDFSVSSATSLGVKAPAPTLAVAARGAP
jgi:hypothetical protein